MKPSSSVLPQVTRVVGYGLLVFAGIDLLFQFLANPFGGALQAFRFSSDVFTKDMIDTMIEMRIKDYDALRLRPHPYEFFMYYDV